MQTKNGQFKAFTSVKRSLTSVVSRKIHLGLQRNNEPVNRKNPKCIANK